MSSEFVVFEYSCHYDNGRRSKVDLHYLGLEITN